MAPTQSFLIERSEQAIHEGGQLYRWLLDSVEKLTRFPLDLGKRYRLPQQSEGFFASTLIDEKPTTLMGTRQLIEFGRMDGPDARETKTRLREFVMGPFLQRAHWTYPDGAPGGFEIVKSVFKRTDGSTGEFAGSEAPGAIDWRDLGRQWQWVLYINYIHDFVMEMGPMKKRLKEAAGVVIHPGFVRVIDNPSADCVLDVTVAYPFIKWAPIPNVFGFGPGKFDNAVKVFSFLLAPDGGVKLRMYFAATPRCERVFDFGPLPDPVYGGAKLLRMVSFGLIPDEPIHKKMDTEMLTQHCRVHQAFAEGVEKVFQTWLTEPSARTASS